MWDNFGHQVAQPNSTSEFTYATHNAQLHYTTTLHYYSMQHTILLTQTLHNNISRTNAIYQTVNGMKKENAKMQQNAECYKMQNMQHMCIFFIFPIGRCKPTILIFVVPLLLSSYE